MISAVKWRHEEAATPEFRRARRTQAEDYFRHLLGLPDGEEIMMLTFFVLTQYRRVTDGRTDRDRRTRCDHY